ncbi:SDR family oxidoreductase [Leeuwenhoekiella nanhaiensis]|uniref:Short-chain dehydrogenase/reductase n=1 Tax=Leeuwenhoekiella nanhaiensis TaxID=1655491 RepID=A0A2G1VR88_9FLAO|nr:SDR family oxidoreductase [Leeuwenhoekiella nanhaiensis]PHQ29140.1 short-chain dehydrogenase/reductase [Leeuwenhoekiella nanhaiensis]
MSQVVLITGASSGIGKSIAEYLVTKGFTVYGTSRNPKSDNLNGVHLIPLDVTKSETIKTAVENILEKEGKLDVLINNAGKGITGPLEEIPEEELKSVFETNYFGPIAVMKAVLPTMRKHRKGLIINVTSIAGYMGLPYRSAYSATKGALSLTTEALRMELKEFNVKVTNVAPGDFATNIASGRYHAPLLEDSDYAKNYGKSLSLMDEHVDEGEDPMLMAKAVFDIINTKEPQVDYKVGAFMQRFSTFLKGVLPGKTYERLLLKHYQL